MSSCEPKPNLIAECFFVRNLSGKMTSFVMVEGETDRAALDQFAAVECALFPSRGKDNVLNALNSDGFIDVPGIAGIIDLDFTLLTNCYDNTSPNLLFDDCYPDLEMILLNSSDSSTLLDVVSDNLTDYEREELHGWTHTLLNAAQNLAMEFGYFRLLNDCNDCGIGFSSFEYSNQPGFINFGESDFIDVDALELRREWTARRLAVSSKDKISWEELLRETAELRKKHPPSNENRIRLCRGKDVIAIIAFVLPHLYQSHFGAEVPSSVKNVLEEKQLAKELREAYKGDYFKCTALCKCIRSWENTNSPYRILKPEI